MDVRTTSGSDAAPRPAELLLLRMLDEIEHGLVLVDQHGRLRYANALGRRELEGDGPLRLQQDTVAARRGDDQSRLQLALDAAVKGRRALLTFAAHGPVASIAVTPLEAEPAVLLALLTFAKRPEPARLTINFYAREQGLTGAESAVLLRLAEGFDPIEIAARQGVAISTVRSQIAAVRAKTRAGSIRELLDRIALLPPIRCALRPASVAMQRRPGRWTEVAPC